MDSFVDQIKNPKSYKTATADSIQKELKNTSYGSVTIASRIITNSIRIHTSNNGPLKFDNCYFQGEVTFNGYTEMHGIVFQNCYFDKEVRIQSGSAKDAIQFSRGEINVLECSGGSWKEIQIYTKAKSITITEGSFQTLRIDGYDIDLVQIQTAKSKVKGFIHLGNGIRNLYLGGTNENCNIEINSSTFEVVWLHELFANGLIKFTNVRCSKPGRDNTGFIIENSDLGKCYFNLIDLSSFKSTSIIQSSIIDAQFTNITWPSHILATPKFQLIDFIPDTEVKHVVPEQLLQQKEAYRQLKYAMNKQGDYLQETKFHILEMRIHYHSLNWFSKKMGDKFILWTSWIFSNYGQRMFVPMVWMIGVHFLLTIIWIDIDKLDGLEFLSTSYDSPTGHPWGKSIELYLRLLNPVHKFEDNLTPGLTCVDLLMRISGSYFLYLIIRASRKFIKGS